jgi:DNA-directed RNA polymerase sigma subunit (sigma70/sigma32)
MWCLTSVVRGVKVLLDMQSTDLQSLKRAQDELDLRLRALEDDKNLERQEFADIVREARKTHSLQAIADVLGVSRQRVDQISKEGNK